MHIESHQYLDLVTMFAPITKWNKQIVRPSISPEITRKAFKIAKNGKPGAVHIDLQENIAAMPAFGHPLKRHGQEKTYASYRSLNAVAMVISKAKNPLILIGNGTIHAQASKA